jgi:IS6 family transposase
LGGAVERGIEVDHVTIYRWVQRFTPLLAIEELMPAAFHNTEQYANNRIECDHGRLTARLRPMRGLKRDHSARVIVRCHALMQNMRRGHYELGLDVRAHRRVAHAFTELARTI